MKVRKGRKTNGRRIRGKNEGKDQENEEGEGRQGRKGGRQAGRQAGPWMVCARGKGLLIYAWPCTEAAREAKASAAMGVFMVRRYFECWHTELRGK
jgi:hypothetical protein